MEPAKAATPFSNSQSTVSAKSQAAPSTMRMDASTATFPSNWSTTHAPLPTASPSLFLDAPTALQDTSLKTDNAL